MTELAQFIIMSAGSDRELLIWRVLLCVARQIVDKLQDCEHSWNMNSFRKTSIVHMQNKTLIFKIKGGKVFIKGSRLSRKNV